MAMDKPRVVIFDDFESNGRFLYRDCAQQKERGFMDYDFPAMLLLKQTAFHNIPVALLSGHPHASKYLRSEQNSIVVPKQDY